MVARQADTNRRTVRVVSVNSGRIVRRPNARGRSGLTAIDKQPREDPVTVSRSGIEGDESNYRDRSLGDTAVHLFCTESYARFEALRGRPLPVPCFGENLTVTGWPESEIRVGDVIAIGSVRLHVNQPVARCSWPGTLAGEPKLLRWINRLGLTGCYLDVLEPGVLKCGDPIELQSRGDPAHTIPRLNAILASARWAPGPANALLTVDALADRWKAELRAALARRD